MGGGSQLVHIIARSILVFGVLGAHRRKLGGQQHVVVALKKSDDEPNNSPTIRREELHVPHHSLRVARLRPIPASHTSVYGTISHAPAPRGAPMMSQ